MVNKNVFLGVIALIVTTGTLAAQTPAPPANSPSSAAPLPVATVDGSFPPNSSLLPDGGSPDWGSTSRVWVSTEYLLWWVKNGPLPVPLVSGNNDPGTIAALTDPGTRVLFGAGSNRNLDYGTFAGLRVSAGAWLDDQATFGVESSGFLLEQRSVLFNAASTGGLTPIVSIPFNATEPFLLNPAGETSFNSGNAPNSVTASSSTRLWGADANFLVSASRGQGVNLVLLAGFRYLDLQEDQNLADQIFDSVTNGTLTVADRFGTRNQFYGGQIGAKAGMTFGRLTLDTVVKVALGDDHETLTINGATTVTRGAFDLPTGVTPQGVFAVPSNIGRYQKDVFTVVPEVGVTVGYGLTDHLRAFVGYNFLYISDVVRPGTQINRNINPTQNTLFGGGTPSGPLVPIGAMHSTDFWAQGVTFGLELRF
jgi:hypothetical protein